MTPKCMTWYEWGMIKSNQKIISSQGVKFLIRKEKGKPIKFREVIII
jgi:hypothetical protein